MGDQLVTALVLAPHHDDETLYAAFTVIRERADVLVLYHSVKQARQGVEHWKREEETRRAVDVLGGRLLDFDGLPDTDERPASEWALWVKDPAWLEGYDRVYAPAREDGGHVQHNVVADLADLLFPGRVTHYLTYTNGGRGQRSTSPLEVEYEAGWIARKLRALSCYESQHGLWATAHHFLGDQREFYAP